ncbi:MAG: acetyl-CoA acetyltransferase [Planctomycetes bacterium]|nr:acetyl-CoA acetyltransferase [Planctomycetota bacterium]
MTAFQRSFIPYGSQWSTPFAKWQGRLASLHPLRLAAESTRAQFERRGIDPQGLDSLVVGWTVPSLQSFYGAPWMAGLIGAPDITGPMVMQACATSVRALQTAAHAIEAGDREKTLVVTFDKCSNGPHVYYPDGAAPGGTGKAENWVMDNFGKDPWARNAMIQTAENVAQEAGISRERQDALTQLRYTQYEAALADDRAFQKRYMLPVEINPSGRKVIGTLDSDDGVFRTTPEGLGKLRPVMPEGTVTFGSQTHPADGNAGCLLTTEAHAKELATDAGVTVRVVSTGEARVKKGFMAMATVPAARQALARAGFGVNDVRIKTHNPFAVNDVYFADEMGIAEDSFNNYGSSLIFGHPQGPTGLRLIAELIEELVMGGGGRGLFVGCAAGDTGAALCLQVDCD